MATMFLDDATRTRPGKDGHTVASDRSDTLGNVGNNKRRRLVDSRNGQPRSTAETPCGTSIAVDMTFGGVVSGTSEREVQAGVKITALRGHHVEEEELFAKLAHISSDGGLQAVVMCPVSRLYQLKCKFGERGGDMLNLRVAALCRTMPFSRQREMLVRRRPHILLATPGCIAALLRGKALHLEGSIAVFTLEMFPVSSKEEFPSSFTEEFPSSLNDAIHCSLRVDDVKKKQALVELFDVVDFVQAIVYVNTAKQALELDAFLADQGCPSIAAHSSLDRAACTARMANFRNFEKRILVTDGSDLSGVIDNGVHPNNNVDLLINVDVPESCAVYLSRFALAMATRQNTAAQLRTLSLTTSTEEAAKLSAVQADIGVKPTTAASARLDFLQSHSC